MPLNNKVLKWFGLATLLFGVLVFFSCTDTVQTKSILVFTKTEGFRHIDAIEAGITAFEKIAQEGKYRVDTTEDAGKFTERNLANYSAVVFLNASGEILNVAQREAFQRYIQAGGGFLAIHAPTDAEREWPWYGQLIGAYFRSHPPTQQATYHVVDRHHPSTDSLPDHFERVDEIYDFDIVNPAINVLVTVDESTYKGGAMGDHHPIVWYHDFDGGRSFYTAMGHTPESYRDSLCLQVILGGLHYVTGGDRPVKLDYTRAVPEQNRFTKTILLEKLDEPMHLAISKNGEIYFAQRRGEIMKYEESTGQAVEIGKIAVSSLYEDGLLGIALDPGFVENKHLFTYFTAPNGRVFHVSRFTLTKEGKLDHTSQKRLLTIPKDVLDGSHTGGGLLFDPNGSGNLFITVGDNSSPRNWGYAPIDERKGREHWDAQRSSANTNDLRGKILRIHPEPDGTYTIPEGNLFPKGMEHTKPEIYSMGHRQPWRISIDSKSGWLYVGEVGPDAYGDSAGLGPKGYDEFNQIRSPGNFGWPYFIADNQAYGNYNFESGKSNGYFDPDRPVNHSVNNTGLKTLPPAQPAFLYYPYSSSMEFPLMGSGGRSATGGPVFRTADFPRATNPFPDYYEGKWFIADWMRNWINVVSFDEQGNYLSMERFMSNQLFSSPIDLQFGRDGSLYMLEYGKGWFRANDDARLIKITYNKGNRNPVAKITADKKAGSLPLTVHLSAADSYDHDDDPLSFQWTVVTETGEPVERSDKMEPKFQFALPGVYKALLEVRDQYGGKDSATLTLVAGNEPPEVSLTIIEGNSSFFFPGREIHYQAEVWDQEDGKIDAVGLPGGMQVHIDYITSGFIREFGHPDSDILPENQGGIMSGILLNSSGCYSCHSIDKPSVGPTFHQIAERYKSEPDAMSQLGDKIIYGGSGNWGAVAMSAHPDITKEAAARMVSFILSLAKQEKASIPTSGSYTVPAPASTVFDGEPKTDGVLFRASYTDAGAGGLPGLYAETRLALRNPNVPPSSADEYEDIMKLKVPGRPGEMVLPYGTQGWIAFKNIDLTGIKTVELFLHSHAGGTVEVRIGGPDGMLVGCSALVEPGQSFAEEGNGLVLSLNPTAGRHELYFVFKNPMARRSQTSFSLNGIRFSD